LAFETVPRLNTLTTDHRGRNKVMWFVWVVAIRDLKDILTVIDIVDSIGEGQLFTAAQGYSSVN
jgi:hypothetical protein